MSTIDYRNGGRPAVPAQYQAASEKQVAFVGKLLAEKDLALIPALAASIQQGLADGLTKQAASAAIDALLPLPRKAAVHKDGEALTEGFYALGDDAFRVVKSKTSGNLYAKVWTGSWEFAPGAINRLVGAERLTVEQAAALGRRYGTCVVCGRTLTAEESVEAGIGPICSGRL